jgi:tetratricopeptide (TPR) repeat protein
MRTNKKCRMIFIAGAAMLVLGIFAPIFVESPKDMGKRGSREYSTTASGLKAETRHILRTSAEVIFLCAMALLFYIEKLDGSLTSETRVARLKRVCRIYKYSLITGSVMFAGQVVFAVAGLLTVRHIQYAHLLHSEALANLGMLLVCVSFFLFHREYMKSVRRAPATVILAAKQKMITLKEEYDLLPQKFNRADIASLPIGWMRAASDYRRFRERAIAEDKPGFYTLVAMVLAALVKHDKHLVEVAAELTKDNVPTHEYLSLAGAALCDLGFQDEGLAMLRAAVESGSSNSSVVVLAACTPDIEEKENLSNRVLSEDPDDCDALRHLAYAKCCKGEIEEAERILNRIMELDPNNAYALECKGDICFDRKEYRKAFTLYRKIRMKPLPVSLQFKICRCYYSLGMMNKAKRIARKIEDKIASAYDIEIEGGIEAARDLLAEILRSQAQPDK